MNPYRQMNNEQLNKLYNKLRQIGEYKKQRKMVDSRQILLDESIRRIENARTEKAI